MTPRITSKIAIAGAMLVTALTFSAPAEARSDVAQMVARCERAGASNGRNVEQRCALIAPRIVAGTDPISLFKCLPVRDWSRCVTPKRAAHRAEIRAERKSAQAERKAAAAAAAAAREAEREAAARVRQQERRDALAERQREQQQVFREQQQEALKRAEELRQQQLERARMMQMFQISGCWNSRLFC